MSAFVPDQPGAAVRVSPNHGDRRSGAVPEILLLHYTGMKSGGAAEAWLCDPRSEVSSHYIVHEDGRIVQMVPEVCRAWHAGVSSWKGRADVNSRSIGVEIVNPGHDLGYPDFPDVQIDAVSALCRDVCARHAIARSLVLAHSDVAPGRKIDPGEKFPWERLAAEGIGHFVPPVPVKAGAVLSPGDTGDAVTRLQSDLSRYGYGIEITGSFDAWTGTVVQAFQRHFRPALVDGLGDRSTVATLRSLLEALPENPGAFA